MILPLWICKHCGRYGGLGLQFSQSMAKVARGEKVEEGKPIPPECVEGHGEMYQVQENDRLAVLPAANE